MSAYQRMSLGQWRLRKKGSTVWNLSYVNCSDPLRLLPAHKGTPALCPPPDSVPFSFSLNHTVTAMSPLIFVPHAIIVFKLPDSVLEYERKLTARVMVLECVCAFS